MSLETRWSEPALLSLAEVLQYTLEEHGEGQYNKMRRQVMDAVRKIAQSPLSAAVETISEKVGFELRGYKVLKEKKETVQRMKAKGFSLDDISDVVGLTVDEVKKLF